MSFSAHLRRLCAAAFLAAMPATGVGCPLSLVLALDVSASIDAREYQLQQEGLARALTDRQVMQAIQAQGGIWLTIFEWSGSRHQYEQLPWTFVEGPSALGTVAAGLRTTPRRVSEFPTSLGYALGHALNLLKAAPETCVRQVIDVSGDGVNNDGFPPASAYVAHDMTLVTVNALAITGGNPAVLDYFTTTVIQRPGAFVQPADSYDDYAEAMRRKLLRELGAFSYVGVPLAPRGG